jgi:GntR family transcriptional regulator, transcriptional repressor for pyruvate dehydrogenase complex
MTKSREVDELKPERLYEIVAQRIRQSIFNGELLPGHRLPSEKEMAIQLDTSRAVLREALRTLEQEGMIAIKRGYGGGAVVANFDGALRALMDSLQTVVKLGQAKSGHLTEVRAVLEPEIARLASRRADPKDLRKVEDVVLAQERELAKGILSRALDMEYHRLVATSAHNSILSITIEAINESLRSSISRSKLTQSMRARVIKYHRDLYEAIRTRDETRAVKLMSEHVADVQCHLQSSDDGLL